MDCGGKRSATPLSPRSAQSQSAVALRLPAHSKCARLKSGACVELRPVSEHFVRSEHEISQNSIEACPQLSAIRHRGFNSLGHGRGAHRRGTLHHGTDGGARVQRWNAMRRIYKGTDLRQRGRRPLEH
jgi:hypothetical protein